MEAGDQLGGLASIQARDDGVSDQGSSSRPGGIQRQSHGNLLMDWIGHEKEESRRTLNLSRWKDGVVACKCREDCRRCRCKRPVVLDAVPQSGDVEEARL